MDSSGDLTVQGWTHEWDRLQIGSVCLHKLELLDIYDVKEYSIMPADAFKDGE